MSGWRAAMVAVAVGAVVLTFGYVLGTDRDGGNGVVDTGGAGLACSPGIEHACRAVAARLGVEYRPWSAGSDLPDRTVLLAPAADLPDGVSPGEAVLRSPIVIGAWRQRALVLLARCGSVDLACVGGAIGSTWEEVGGSPEWGEVKLALADPTRSEEGLLGWVSAAGLTPDREAMSLALTLVAASDARLVADMVLFGDSRADLAITTEASLAGQMANAPGRGGRLEVFYPDSSPWVEYVTAGEGRGTQSLIEDLSSAELASVWAAAGLRPALHSPDGLMEGLGVPGTEAQAPDQATRARLLEEWKEVR